MRIWAFILTLAVAGLTGQEGRADYLNPTSHRDCQTFNWTISQQLSTARQTASQCFSANYATPGNFPRHMSRNVCGKENYYDDELPACAGTRLRVCQIEDEIQRRENICKQRLASYQARQAALEAQQKEAERLQRENERIARENGRLQIANSVVNRYGTLPDGPGTLSDDAHDLGARVAQMSGVRMTGDQGAYTLSRAMSQVGNRIVGRLTQRSLGELDGALTQFSANNPRPTAAQLESYNAQRAAIAGQYATHMTRVQNTDYTLPLNDKSAVVGAYAGTILQLVELRNAGEIDEPIAALGAVAATYLAVRAYREAEKRANEARVNRTAQGASPTQLRAARQATIAPVRAERARIAEAARIERERKRIQAELDATTRQLELDAQRRDREWAEFQREQERLRQDRLRREREQQQRINTMIGIIGGIAQGLNGQTAPDRCPAEDMRQCGRCSCELGRGGP